MGKPHGFREYKRRDPGYRPVVERLGDFKAVELPLSEDEVVKQAARCMDCGVPFCHGCGCPLCSQIPELNDLVYRQRWKDALDLLLSSNPFPEFTARVCPALCEGSCVLGINGEAMTIRQVEMAIIEKAYAAGYIAPAPPARRLSRKVAVIGSGPAGLTVAEFLNKAGYHVTVFDNAAKPGGILRYGIPDFKLEKWIIDRRITLMEGEGVIFECGVNVGADLSARYLLSRFDAICLCAGARAPRDITVPGRELKNIHFAMDFLVQQNRMLAGEQIPSDQLISADHKRVVILGGGDTGADCLGTALRQGARHVVQMEILPKPPPARATSTPWPAWPHMMRESSSHKEGGERRWSVSTCEFLGRDGAVAGVRAIEVEWPAIPGAAPSMTQKPGTEFTVDADLVLLAMGFTGPQRNMVIDELRIVLDTRGNIRKDENGMTSVTGVFAAGDMARGASLVVRAIADGRATASGIVSFLEREDAARG